MKCFLSPLEEADKRPQIVLENGKAKMVGRSEESEIINKRCSKQQVQLTANFATKTVKVHQVGVNHSGINGKIVGMGITHQANDKDVIELLLGLRYMMYKVNFESPLDTLASSPPKKMFKMFDTQQGTQEELKTEQGLGNGMWNSVGDGAWVYSLGENIKEAKPNIASFDLDYTIISTKSGKKFATGPEDWKFLYPQSVECLRKFFSEHEDFKFVIFTNQAGASDVNQQEHMKKKLEKITQQINIPALVFMATQKNKYRKPMTGGWDILIRDYNGGVEPNLQTSFYCGDAAGRKKDFAISDRLFALNIGLTFKVPEQFFLCSTRLEEMSMPVFDPKKYMAQLPDNDRVKFPQSQEMIIMVGCPASGKSTYVKNVIVPKGYSYVNRDTLKTPAKCLSAAENALQNKQSVVIDNTSPEMKDRAEYIKLAKKFKVPVRCFKMNVDHAHALHNNKFRSLTNETQISVPTVAFNTFKSKFQDPILEEGYLEIVKINFAPNFDSFPDSEYRKKLYGFYLLEK